MRRAVLGLAGCSRAACVRAKGGHPNDSAGRRIARFFQHDSAIGVVRLSAYLRNCEPSSHGGVVVASENSRLEASKGRGYNIPNGCPEGVPTPVNYATVTTQSE